MVAKEGQFIIRWKGGDKSPMRYFYQWYNLSPTWTGQRERAMSLPLFQAEQLLDQLRGEWQFPAAELVHESEKR